MRAHTPVFATAFAALTLATAACSDDSTVATQPELSARRVIGATSVSVTPSDTSVAVGGTVQLSATGTDRGNASDREPGAEPRPPLHRRPGHRARSG